MDRQSLLTHNAIAAIFIYNTGSVAADFNLSLHQVQGALEALRVATGIAPRANEERGAHDKERGSHPNEAKRIGLLDVALGLLLRKRRRRIGHGRGRGRQIVDLALELGEQHRGEPPLGSRSVTWHCVV